VSQRAPGTGPEGGRAQPRGGRPRSAEAEQAILRAALEILGTDGFASFSIEAVAARAGVGRPTVYRRWPGKLELAVDAVIRLAPPFTASDTGDPLADLRTLIASIVPELTGSAAGKALMALTSDPQAHAEFAQLLERYLEGRRAVLKDLIRKATATSQLPAGTDPELLIDLILGTALYRWLVTGTPVTRQAAGQMADAILALAGGQPGTAATMSSRPDPRPGAPDPPRCSR
jgi:AcrR family transcriptional regulator